MEYALYKGENLLSMGSIYKIAKDMNVDIRTIQYYKTEAYKRKLKNRTRKNHRILVPIGN